MAALSIFRSDYIAVGCANPIFPLDNEPLRDGGVLRFELFERDATMLKRLRGKVEQFGFEHRAFMGELLSLELCEATSTALQLVGKPVMRGEIRIHRLLRVEAKADQN